MKNTDIQIIASLKELLGKAKLNIAIIPHEHPDGDAIGSAIGLAEVLVVRVTKLKLFHQLIIPIS
ncbi:MAG: hypothetical protein IPF54_27195 [Draconibacterium sp.]|nr:hypothetical protein [Draconibacterium sp.]